MSNTQSTNAIPWERAEGLRSPESTAARDPRNAPMLDLAAQHARVEGLVLSARVPGRIRVAFDTARNLYLYAWHVYRFYPVAELQALGALEAGLRQALPTRLPPAYQRPHQEKPMLHGLLNFAIDQGTIRNEGFRRWHERADDRARQRQDLERLIRMAEQGLNEWVIDPGEPIEVIDEDRAWDLVDTLRQSLHSRRNAHAHGDGPLTPFARGTLELVAEILNQLYPEAKP